MPSEISSLAGEVFTWAMFPAESRSETTSLSAICARGSVTRLLNVSRKLQLACTVQELITAENVTTGGKRAAPTAVGQRTLRFDVVRRSITPLLLSARCMFGS